MKPQFSIHTTDTGKNGARFVCEPLPQGYGHTLGTSLRRVLYSSIPGAAITSIRITGANHQFSTLPGVAEDLVHLVLNIKQIKVMSTSDKPAKMNLFAKGVGPVTASDFECPSGVEIVNPDLVIANLTEKAAKLEIEATVETGYGYSPADDRKSTTVGVIPTDAIFSPVVRVNVTVEATRVGRMTNFDKLILDVTTDGTITPAKALTTASETLVEYFQTIVTPVVSEEVVDVKVSNATKIPVGGLLSIEELDLPTRIANALQKAGFDTVADLYKTSKEELAKVKNVGSKSVKLIESALSGRGLILP